MAFDGFFHMEKWTRGWHIARAVPAATVAAAAVAAAAAAAVDKLGDR